MLSRKKILVIQTGLLFVAASLLVFFIGSGPADPRLGLMILAALQSAVFLGLVWTAYVVGRRTELTAKSVQPLESKLEVLDRNTQQKLEDLGRSLSRELDSLDRASQARFLRVDQLLGRQGRRVEATYLGVQHHFLPLDSVSGDELPLLTQISETKDLLERTNTSLLSLRAEVDQGSKRLREHSGHLRRILKEQSKISSDKALLAQAAVIEELLEGMDSIAAHNHRIEM